MSSRDNNFSLAFGDYREMEDGFGMLPHHWTVEEIEKDCKYVIDQLNEKYAR